MWLERSMRILIAEDSNVSRRLLESTLTKWGHDVVSTSDGDEAWKVLERDDHPDLAIIDWLMPGLEGPDICRKLRQMNRGTYVVLLTAKTGSEDLVAGLEAGADDFISKPFNRDELRARVQVGTRIIHLQQERDKQIQQLKELSAQLEEISLTDQLTGVSNRRQFDRVLATEWNRALRKGSPIGAVMLDIDSFKKFNDEYGHQAGDDCLRRVAQALKHSLMRAGDFLGRYGGEEFVALIPDANETNVAKLAEIMRASVQDLQIPHSDSRSKAGVVTISLGLTVRIPDAEMRAEDLVKLADKALYKAKEAGGNQTKVEMGGKTSEPGDNA
jgi:diguanylate cyclase (GGDEF)-like protein